MKKIFLLFLCFVFIGQLTFSQNKKHPKHSSKYHKQLKWTGKFTKNDKDVLGTEPA